MPARWKCPSCGGINPAKKILCLGCNTTRTPSAIEKAIQTKINSIPIVTSPADPSIAEYRSMVWASTIVNYHETSNVISSEIHMMINIAKMDLIKNLQEQAHSRGGDAVVNTNFSYTQIGPGSLLLTADATAVSKGVGSNIGFFIAI